MRFGIKITPDAVQDLADIVEYIASNDSIDKAINVSESIENAVLGLANNPARGTYPKEMLLLGVRDFREVFFKPYRIIYRVIGHTVYVYVIADGRRDMRSLLQKRLLIG